MNREDFEAVVEAALAFIRETPGCTVADVRGKVRCSQASIYDAISRLEERGMIERRPVRMRHAARPVATLYVRPWGTP